MEMMTRDVGRAGVLSAASSATKKVGATGAFTRRKTSAPAALRPAFR